MAVMENDRQQKELFDFEETKKPFSGLAHILPKPDFEGKVAIVLTLEKMVFISIGIVMLMVLVYALGVETGKSRKIRTVTAQQEVKRVPIQSQAGRIIQPVSTTLVVPVVQKTPVTAAAPAAQSTKPLVPAVTATNAVAQDSAKPYTIVVAAFSKKETAQASAARLTKDGFAAFVYQSGSYSMVCVGSYADKYGIQVKQDLNVIKRTYKDAYIKLR